MKIVITGSIAFDYLMQFQGKFTEHFLPEHMEHVSLSFLVDSMDKRKGGCGPNIAYTLALLGEQPLLMATAGQDFGEYGQWLEEAGVDTTFVKRVTDKYTASFFCSTDTENNQIASFYPGAMTHAAELSFQAIDQIGLVIISPNNPVAMLQYAEECRALEIPFIFDPGQQCTSMSGDELKQGLVGSKFIICNDYEFGLIQQKTSLEESDLLQKSGGLVITRGEQGALIQTQQERYEVAAVKPNRNVDPTGIGDAYRGGLLKGIAMGLGLRTSAQIGSVAATYVLEELGGMSHKYSLDEFKNRYEKQFGSSPF